MTHAKQLQKELALWIVRLNVDDLNERQQVQIEFEAWRREHPELQAQLDQMFNFAEQMQNLSTTHGISSQTVHSSLEVSQHSQNHIQQLFGKSFVFFCAFGVMGYMSYHYFPFAYYAADFKTKTGEMQSFVLNDGSKITLGAKSAIKLNFSHDIRRIDLVQGDVYIDVAQDRARPFLVHTPQADYKALGTRFIVNQYPTSSTLSMLHSKVEVSALGDMNVHKKTVKQGERLNTSMHGFGDISPITIASTELAWQKHQILADDMPLSDLLTRLNRYHSTYLVFDHAALSQYKITGVINAQQDLAQTLKLLLSQYPQLNITTLGNYVIFIRST